MARSLSNLKSLCRSLSVARCYLSTTVIRFERLRHNSIPLRSNKAAKCSEEKSGKHFVDWCRVRVKGGNGGNGNISLASIFATEFAGPDGGNGGNGAHVIFRASSQFSSLGHIRNHVKAPDGVNGGNCDMDGKNAADLFIDVPIGTIFRNLDREVVGELVEEGALMIAARGGAGGRGNSAFKSSTCQTPQIAEEGAIGEDFTFDIELRTMAHFGFIGFPNAGKSTLLRAISRARPRVAAYPFTTLQPHIGIVFYDDLTRISVADIPGIIKDAHKNKGLGISFLRHVERCLCLLYVVDVSIPDAFDQFQILRFELDQYKTGLSSRPHGILANKMDLEDSKNNFEIFKNRFESEVSKNVPIIPISGKMSQNVSQLLYFMRDMYDQHQK